MKKFINLSLGLSLVPFFALSSVNAQEPLNSAESSPEIEEILVSASLIPIAANRSANAITVIDSEQIKLRAPSSIADLLRDVPGFAVSQSGGLGALTEIRARGAESNHLVVLIDGIEVNDPSQNDMTNWGTLSTAEIERIEIVRGPQSAIQGSDAIAGVVNIITANANKPYSANIFSELGSFSSSKNGFNVGHSSDKLNIKFGASHYETAGNNIRPATGTDDDGYRNTGLNLKAAYKVSDEFTASLTSRHSYGMAEYDEMESEYDEMVSELMHADFDREFTKVQGDFNSADGLWAHTVKIAQSDFENNQFNNAVAAGGTESDKENYQYTGTRFIENNNQQISVALEKETQNFKQHVTSGVDNKLLERNLDSVALEYRFDPSDAITLAASARHEDNDSFENATTGRLEAVYRQFDNLKWRAVWGTAVKNPTYTELYGNYASFEANEFLIPEKSNSWELGVDAGLLDNRMQLSATYFNSKLENEIDTDWNNCDEFWVCPLFNNTQKSNRKGLELSSSFLVSDVMQASAAYTYTDSKDGSGTDEGRRPKDIASLNISWQPRTNANVNLNIQYNGEQFGWNPTDEYTLVDLSTNVSVTNDLDVYLNLSNLFDEDYQDVDGYETLDFGLSAGFRYKLK
ncbi:TonB-dependent receptor [Porticoccaceae bacterium]|nr:TonB-dependent receptor [Porticoccaceae bacterium]